MTPEPEETQPVPTAEETAQPAQLQVPAKASAFARALYRRYNEAASAGHDEECFSLLQRLLTETPRDAVLLANVRSIGKRLYKSTALALPEVLERGNLSAITQLVTKLRLMADEEDLLGLVGFREAAQKVDAAERRHWQGVLNNAMSRLRAATEIHQREEMALSIGIFAQEKQIELSPEQSAVIARVHEDWHRFCRAEKLRADYRKQVDTFRALEQKIAARQELPECEQALHHCHQETSALRELSEAKDLLELIETQQARVRAILTARHRRKVVIRTVACVVASIIALTIAAIAFFYARGGSLRDSIVTGMAQKKVVEVSNLVGGIDPMRRFCKAVHSGYAEALQQGDAWLKVFNGYQAEIAAITPELSEATDMLTNPAVSAAELTSGLVLVDKVRKVEDKLKAEFNTTASKEATVLMGKFYDRLAEIRPRVLNRFLQPSPQADMDGLKALYAEFLSCTGLLDVTEAESAEVRQAMHRAAAVVLRRQSLSSLEPSVAQSAVDAFDAYVGELPLQNTLREELVQRAEHVRTFAVLPQSLRGVADLAGFAAAIEACGECYDSVANGVSPAEIRALIGKEDAAMRAYKLADFKAVEKYPIAPEQILPNLQAVKSMYAEGASVYSLGRPEKMDELIDVMLSDRNNVWKNGLKRAVQDSSVYIGTVARRGKNTVMTLSNGQGLPARRKVNLREAAVKGLTPVVLADQREAMGFVREKLSAGELTPARLMKNIAAHTEANCPEMARAYMFARVVRMVELLDPYSSGLAFSESLRQDIEAFKAISSSSSLYPGCWFIMHSTALDERWRKFFELVASRDYYAEVLNAVLPITDSHCVYAGFVGADGKAVRCREGEEPLYFIKGDSIVPYTGTAERPYTPLFRVELPE